MKQVCKHLVAHLQLLTVQESCERMVNVLHGQRLYYNNPDSNLAIQQM